MMRSMSKIKKNFFREHTVEGRSTIISIDPSLTGTAVFIGSHPCRYHHERFSSKPLGQDTRNRILRFEDLAARVYRFCRNAENVSHIVIEDYSYGTNDANSRYVAEYRGILGYLLSGLWDRQPIIVDANIQHLKKYVTGKANTKKEFLRVETYKRWEVEFDSNDEVDAYGLYRIGLCLNGHDTPETNAQREVIQKLEQKIEQARQEPAPF